MLDRPRPTGFTLIQRWRSRTQFCTGVLRNALLFLAINAFGFEIVYLTRVRGVRLAEVI
jgi:hypothetical protein